MPKNKNRSLFNKILKKMNILKKEKSFSEVSSALKSGKNTYMRLDRLESSNFDMVWIKKIEDCIYDLGEIIANPREVTKVVTSIVPVELAKKTGSESVMHLASHTQYIKDITPEGDVVPNKILNIGAEEDIHTYENRFIATLIRRLVLFIQKRYEFVKKFAPLHDEEILYFKNKSIVDGAEVEIETKIKVRSESSTQMADVNNKYIDRIMKIREYILYFYGSRFMKEMKTERDVRNPIVMTNILRKNPKYHKCYELYRFIEKYEGLGVSYKVNEEVSNFSEQEMNEMNSVMMANYLALKAKDKKKLIKSTNKQYKPKVLTSLDDEEFVYGDLLKGPIEFLRVDQGYLDYLESKVKKDLPIHPTKLEKEYYKEEYQEKADVKAEKVALDKLQKRKKKEQADFDKKAQAMVALREKEEQERIAAEKEAARLEEEKRIEAIRQQLIEQAQSEKPVEPEPVVEEAPVIEEQPQEEAIPATQEPVSEQPVEEQPQPIEEAKPVEETPIEEPVVEEQPVEQVQQEEVVEEQPQAEEVIQVVAEEARIEEAPAEEQPVEVEPVVEEKVEEPVQEAEPQPEPEPAQEAAPVEPEPQKEEVVEQPKKRKSKLVWITFTDSHGHTKKVPQKVYYDDEEEQQVVAKPVIQPEPQPVVEEKVEEPAPQPEPVKEEPKPEPVAEQPKKRKSKLVWITFTDSHGHTKKVPQKVYYDEDEEPEAEPQPQPAPVQEAAPVEPEPVKEEKAEEPVEEVVEQPEPAPVQEEEQPQEEPVLEEPQEEPEVVEEPVVEEAPVVEEQPVEEAPVEEVEKNQEKAEISEEKEDSAEILEENKPEKHTRRERKPKKEKPQTEENLGPKLEPIPGRFIVKTSQGYFVNKNKYSVYKNEAWVFGDFNDANKVKNTYGGKVVKL